jgi:hypothetical protein
MLVDLKMAAKTTLTIREHFFSRLRQPWPMVRYKVGLRVFARKLKQRKTPKKISRSAWSPAAVLEARLDNEVPPPLLDKNNQDCHSMYLKQFS